MNVLRKCCFRSLRENKRRTAVTIIGVILATALITAVACMAVSLRASLVAYEREQNGDFHYLFTGVRAENLKYFENNRNIAKLGIAGEVGYAALEGSRNPDKPYLYIRALDERGIEAMSLKLKNGRMPQNGEEIVVGSHVRSNGGVEIKVGDTLSLDVGERISDGWELKQGNSYTYEEERLKTKMSGTYRVVGIIERPNYFIEQRMAPGYSAFTYLEDPGAAEELELYVTYSDWGLRHAETVTAGLLGVPEELYRTYCDGGILTEAEETQLKQIADAAMENYWLIKWLRFNFSSSILNMLYSMAFLAVVIIIVTSVFCIRNSFFISLTEKMKLYGRLASVGTTSRQQKKIVYYEAGFIGLVGIPLGIASGLLAAWVLVKIVGELVKVALGYGLVFGVSLPALALAAVLSAVTVFFSAARSAKRAAKVSPISAIRGNDTVKRGRRKLRCPKLIGRCFGVGGVIAYKNLKRARVKYRTTVVSIVVSVAVFIGVSTFVDLMKTAAGVYYEDKPYQLRVTIEDEDACEKAALLAGAEGVRRSEIKRQGFVMADTEEIPFTEDYRELFGPDNPGKSRIMILSLGEAGYRSYCREVGVPVEQAGEKAIVYARYSSTEKIDGKYVVKEGEVAHYKPGDVIRGDDGNVAGSETAAGADGEGQADTESRPEQLTEIEVLCQTDRAPMVLSGVYTSRVYLIVSDEWMDEHSSGLAVMDTDLNVFLDCEDPDAIEDALEKEYGLMDYRFVNYEAEYRSERSMYLVVSIFLYGFIIVVALIGVTNIFNTVTTNMELRAPEFAMLRAVGMTGSEFRRMIWLEGVFYGGKALLIGIPLGLLISLGFHRALAEGVVKDFRFPAWGILTAAAAVFLLLFCIMRYSMGKINRRNIIETIQNENI